MTPSPTDLVEALDEAIRTMTAARTEATEAHRTEDAYEVARHVANAAHDVRELEAQAVALLRGWGGSWTDVGNVYGTTRQAAHERFGGGS